MQIQIIQPDDWHIHLRDNDILASVAPMTARQFNRAVVMPNLNPPITTTQQALDYRDRVLATLPDDTQFEPLMTLYLTDNTTADEISRAHESDFVKAVKFYPAGATTNSDDGVTDLNLCHDAIAKMQELEIPLLIHGEATDHQVDVFDREKFFIDQTLIPMMNRYPDLKIVFEHITTADAVDFVQDTNNNIAATITPQHLLFNRNMMFKGGIRPHHYCLPILKRENHRQALVYAATKGNKKFFLGTDSAPHAINKKENACGCAGIFSAHAAIELYTQVFEEQNALDKLEAFASFNGPDFYKLPRNGSTITLRKEPWTVPDTYPLADESIVPLMAGETLQWKLVS